MTMLFGEQIDEARLTDWRKLAQGLHARYLTDDFTTGVRFVAAVGEAGDEVGHHPRATIGHGHVDLELVTSDAIYRDDEGAEHDAALDRLTSGEYGTCERCGRPIGPARLEARPTARRCIACASQR